MRIVLASAALSAGIRSLPRGESLPQTSWERRHRGVLILLAIHAVGLLAFGLAMGASTLHAIGESFLIGAIALLASLSSLPPRTRSIIASFGLMSSSAVLTHLSGGYIEAHFHFFVMLGVIFLYEDWLPYVLSVGYVAVHHGVMGTLDPGSVFNHAGALSDPWLWAGIHAFFILGLSAALVVAWGILQSSRESERVALTEARGLRVQLHSQEKMAALGSLVSGLAHEVRTPLTIVSTNAAILHARADRFAATPEERAEVGERIREIDASVDRMNELVQQLRRFHKRSDGPRESLPLDPLVQEAIDLFRTANKSAPAIRVHLRSPRPAPLDSLGVQQVVLNLLTNAVDAIGNADGTISLDTYEVSGAPVLVIEDTGSGIPDSVRSRIFEPLFTTRKEGMGLGLSIVKRIVDDHRGEIECISSPGKGTTFRVTFGPPRVHRPEAPRPVSVLAESAAELKV